MTDQHYHVSVQLSACGREDADTVFAALDAAFPERVGGAGRTGRPGRTGGAERPTVWSTTVDAGRRDGPGPLRTLGTEVLADLSGGYQAVGLVREALAETFRVEDRGAVSGDQETDVRLALASGGG